MRAMILRDTKKRGGGGGNTRRDRGVFFASFALLFSVGSRFFFCGRRLRMNVAFCVSKKLLLLFSRQIARERETSLVSFFRVSLI